MHTSPTRRGTALPIVFAVSLLIGGMLIVSSDRVLGMKKLQDIGYAPLPAAVQTKVTSAIGALS